jgi:hypothetical protein
MGFWFKQILADRMSLVLFPFAKMISTLQPVVGLGWKTAIDFPMFDLDLCIMLEFLMEWPELDGSLVPADFGW